MPKSAYRFDPDRQEWIGVVFEDKFLRPRTIHTIGVMDTEQGIKLWLATVVRNRAWETGSEPADKYS